MHLLDTIAAVSTPRGKGGVALLRVSGPEAVAVAARVFCPKSGRPLSEVPPRTAVFGTISAPDGEGWQPVDEGLATVFRAPASFTGEDTVEICCHGGALLTRTVLEALLAAGARPAEAGEFTRRAHLNGKLGLSAAEALGSLLEAGNRRQLTLAYGGMEGKLGDRTRACYDELLRVMSAALACIDFPEEDLAEMSREEMTAAVRAVKAKLETLSRTYRTGHAVAEGIPTVIAGRTNAGKSSLYNRLLGREAAIVTDIEGTTRDILCESATLGGVTLRLYDTAGLRQTEDTVERLGIDRARRALDEAELILALFDLTRPLSPDERTWLDELAARRAAGQQVLPLLNKADAAPHPDVEPAVAAALGETITLSTATGQGMDVLSARVEALFLDGSLDLRQDAVIANARQYAAVVRAVECLGRTLEALDGGLPIDLCCTDLGAAMQALGEVDGRAVNEDVVAEIFKNFCVGK